METHALRCFVEVARRRSFTKASQHLHLTQPAVSRVVKGLEDHLGVPLLLRERGGVTLTEAGRLVLERAEGVLDSLHGIEEEVEELGTLRRGRVRVGLPPMVGAAFFPPVVAAFRRKYPGVALELREEGARNVEALVVNRDLDVAATVLPTDEAAFDVMPFVRDVLLVVLRRGHPLARQREVALRDLERIPFVLYTPDFALHGNIVAACRARGFTPAIASESSQWDFIAALVAADMGVAIMPRTICRRLDQRLVATVRLGGEPGLRWDLALIWRRGRYLPAATRAWIDLARELLV